MELLGEAAPGRSTGEAMSLMENPSRCQTVLAMTGQYVVSGTVVRYRAGRCTQSHLLSFSSAPAASRRKLTQFPFSRVLVVPLGGWRLVCSASLRGLNNDVYFRAGLLTTIGLLQNAILIVEFAKDPEKKDVD